MFSQDLNMQNGSFSRCDGFFYDSGGDTGNYGPNENFTLTICPDMTDMRTVLEFVEFELADGGLDIMAVYDSNTADPSALIGNYTGSLNDLSNDSLNYITASDANLSGCLTIEFNSSDTIEDIGWAANISCREACPIVDISIDSISPAIFNGDDYELCYGDQITFDANVDITSGDPELISLDWDFDNGNSASGEVVTTTFDGPGFYDVAITANYPNCDSETFFVEVHISNRPEIELTAEFEQICIGEQVELLADANTVAVTRGCDKPVVQTTYLPDGTGASYDSSITLECFDPNQTITSASDIQQICMTLEHSYLGDLDISLISPDGTEIILVEAGATNGQEIWLGEPNPQDNGVQGIGYEYCFNLSAASILADGTTIELPNPQPENPDFTTPSVVPGSYLPLESFNDLIGTTLNGEWTLEITDNIQFDDGFIFEWSIDLDNSIIPEENIFEPNIIKQEWINYEGQGNPIFFTTTEEGNYCFEYEVIDSFGCIFTEEICVDVLPLPFVDSTEDLYECDADPNTPTEFDLTSNDANIFGSQDPNDFILSYHNSLDDALDGVNPIENPDSYLTSDAPETIYVRLLSIVGDCVNTDSFQLIDSGQIDNIPPLETCTLTGQDNFDLTQLYPQILSPGQNLTTYTITFHHSQTDASLGINEILDEEAYENQTSPETIWVRVENTIENSCFDIGSFEIITHEQPVISLPANDIVQCTTVSQSFDLTVNNPNSMGVSIFIDTNVTYHESLEDANNDLNPITTPDSYSIDSDFETVWVRIENQNFGECFDVSSFNLEILESAPINLNPTPLVECDDDNDGFYNNFDLTEKDDEIGLNSPITEITYHLTEEDALNDIGAITSPYSNVVENIQTIYFRTEDTNSGCVQVGSFEIQVVDSPLLTPLNGPLIGCDEDDDGSIFFDLTQVENQVLGTSLNPADLEINYHLSLADAQNNINAIAQASNFQNTSSPQTVWIRVIDITNSHACFDIEPIELIVSPLPEFVFAEPFIACDDEAGGGLSDETAFFDFNDVIDEITQVNNELLVEFFETPEDRENNNPISPIDNYQNLSNPQTIYIRITSETTGCSGDSSFTIVVEPTPSLAPDLAPLRVCDADNDGFEEFDLGAAIPDILNNEPEVTITFHLTQAAADLGVNPINTSNPFGLINPNQQTLYVRAENTGPEGNNGSGCYDTRPIDLIVDPSPEIEELNDLTTCDDESPNGFTTFDLTVNTDAILGNQNASEVEVTYHETQEFAEEGINPIAVPSNYTNLTNPQTIYVRLEDIETGCYDLYNSSNDINNSFTLSVESIPIAIAPTDLEICNDNAIDEPFPQSTFDLTEKEPEISGVSIVPENLEFTYFETQADLDNNVNPIQNPNTYINQSQPQDIFVKIVDTSTENLCFNSTVMTLSVLPLPSPSETDLDVLRIEGCDDDNDGVAALAFDLTQSGVLIAESETVDITYYESESGAEFQNEDDLIATPTAYINDPNLNVSDDLGNLTNTQIIYARVDNNVEGNFCYVVVPFEIVVNPAPQLNPNGDPFAYTLCEDDNANPGFATIFSTQDITEHLWDITNGSSNQIIPLLDSNINPAQNIEDMAVTYHESLQDAENGIEAIQPGYTASDGQILYIRVVNIETGCYNTNFIGLVQIIIEARPGISDDALMDIHDVCADEVGFPNAGTVNLTVQDAFINPNNPDETSVIYYAGMMDYNNGIAIEDPVNFQTTESPQTIIAEVINNLTLCESSDFVNFDVFVKPLPNLDISGFDELVVCFGEDGELIENEVSPPTIETGLDSSNFSFEWELDGSSLSETSSSYTATQPGNYTVTATNINSGCQASGTATILESVAPEFEVLVISTAFSPNQSVEVTVTGGTGNFEFQLDDGQWISLPQNENSLVFNNVPLGTHTIRGRDDSGCGFVTERFTIIDYPRFFTPNQDNINDTWNITGLNQADASLYIFDRYGKLLKELKPDGQGWDGTFNGKPMPSQSYWFRIDFREPSTGQPTTFRAHFALKR